MQIIALITLLFINLWQFSNCEAKELYAIDKQSGELKTPSEGLYSDKLTGLLSDLENTSTDTLERDSLYPEAKPHYNLLEGELPNKLNLSVDLLTSDSPVLYRSFMGQSERMRSGGMSGGGGGLGQHRDGKLRFLNNFEIEMGSSYLLENQRVEPFIVQRDQENQNLYQSEVYLELKKRLETWKINSGMENYINYMLNFSSNIIFVDQEFPLVSDFPDLPFLRPDTQIAWFYSDIELNEFYILISIPAWNKLSGIDQVALLSHELLRSIQFLGNVELFKEWELRWLSRHLIYCDANDEEMIPAFMTMLNEGSHYFRKHIERPRLFQQTRCFDDALIPLE